MQIRCISKSLLRHAAPLALCAEIRGESLVGFHGADGRVTQTRPLQTKHFIWTILHAMDHVPRDDEDTARETAPPLRRATHRGGNRRQQRPLQPVPRYALTKSEAAFSLGMSVDTFERRVQPFLRVILCGQLVLIPPSEIEKWVGANAHHLVSQPP